MNQVSCRPYTRHDLIVDLRRLYFVQWVVRDARTGVPLLAIRDVSAN